MANELGQVGGLLGSTIEHWRDFGARETLLAAVSRLMTIFAGPVLRRRTPPSLYHLHLASSAVYLRPQEAAEDAMRGRQTFPLDAIVSEYEEVRREMREAYARTALTYPEDRRVTGGSAFLIYALVRGLTPRLMLETGIANGHSTFVILSAMARNAAGRLVSLDVDPSTGGLVDGLDQSRWDKRIIDASYRKRSLERIVSSLEPVDLFLHDSDHSYRWQRLEYETVHPRMAQSALMASDDVDSSFAFIDFCHKIDRRPTLLVEPRKVFGVVNIGAAGSKRARRPAGFDD